MQSPKDQIAPEIVWPQSTKGEALAGGTIQVWGATLVDETAVPADLTKQLSGSEIHRAAGFTTGVLQRRFIRSRITLRRVLAARLGVPPVSLRFETLADGKPILPDHPELQFNLSHSGDLMLLALTSGCPVGVDVESIRRTRDPQGIANRFFTPREAEWLRRMPPGEVPASFFRLWTRKEAVLKATGGGISSGLRSVELLGSDGGLKTTVGQSGSGASWTVVELIPAKQFVGALAFPASRAEMTIQTLRMG